MATDIVHDMIDNDTARGHPDGHCEVMFHYSCTQTAIHHPLLSITDTDMTWSMHILMKTQHLPMLRFLI